MKQLALMLLAVLVLTVGCDARPRHYNLEVKASFPHDEASYTQGLFFHDGKLYESTGQYSESTFRVVDLTTGSALRKFDFASKYFVEGSVILGDKLYILTWTNKLAFIYDAKTLEYKSTVRYPREGWGLTTDGQSLIASDGSSRLYWMDEKFAVQKTVTVKLDGRPVQYLNELEWIDGKIWANVYTSDLIMIINPANGEVEGVVNCKGLLPDKLRDDRTDVLNGIAFNPADGKIYLTGKYWKKLFQVVLVPAS